MKLELASICGNSVVNFDMIDVKLVDNAYIPSIDTLLSYVDSHPDLLISNLEIDEMQGDINCTKAEAISDLSVSSGFVRNNEEKENAFVLGFGIEIPLFNRGKNEVKKLQYEQLAKSNVISWDLLARKAEIKNSYSTLHDNVMELSKVNEVIIPKTEIILEEVDKLYQQGNIGIVDLIETRTSLQELKTRKFGLMAAQAQILTDIYELCNYEVQIFNKKTTRRIK
jgi:outer membrane protein TolC